MSTTCYTFVTKKFNSTTDKDPLYPFDYSVFELLDITEDDIKDIESKLDNIIFTDDIF